MPLSAILLLALLCLGASWLDITSRRLPNWLSALTLISGLVTGLVIGGSSALGWQGSHAGAALLGGMVLYAFGAIGAGDAKFYAAVAAWFPLQEGLRLFVGTTMSGLLVLVALMIVRRIRGAARVSENSGSADVPYGVAIALGGLLTAI